MKVRDVFITTDGDTLVHVYSLEKDILWEGTIKNIPLIFINKEIVQLRPISKDTISLILDISTNKKL